MVFECERCGKLIIWHYYHAAWRLKDKLLMKLAKAASPDPCECED